MKIFIILKTIGLILVALSVIVAITVSMDKLKGTHWSRIGKRIKYTDTKTHGKYLG